ncbi:hypothetical protein DICVIV_01571 [Dictyocaulus viviparus]|uniref:Receptor ligand binding region domain-containing protein n=1 Tax=Dictyocaulus viviparus TaxID=29172 RepID=A0A0D8Y5Y6_DICVI|nr:hypothetical protein DICVIV_01571 [Dictyocaulus viviparus]
MWRIILAAFVGVIHEGLDATESLCSVYDPFKVQPDNVKRVCSMGMDNLWRKLRAGSKLLFSGQFQIGGIFPLHDVNCKKLLPDTVQEVIAIQWALTHWNQNPANHHSKLGIGLYAADTCSRAQETVSQTLRFLDTVGYHEPRECRTENPKAKLLGLIAPKDFSSAKSMGTVLTTAELPIAAYTSNSVDALLEIGVHNVIATTPTIHVYVDVLIRVMNQLNEAGIFVSDVVDIEHPQLAYALENGDSSIIVSLLSPEEVLSSVARKNNFTNLIYHKEIGRQIDATADFVTYKNDDEIVGNL